MAHQPKKGRPASVTLVKAPAPAPVIATPAPAPVETPAPVEAEVSLLALQAAEPPAPAPELPEAPAVIEDPIHTEIVAAVEAAPAPVAVAPPAPVEPPAPALTDNVRSLFERGLNQTKLRFDDVKAAAQETAASVEASYGALHSGVAALNAKALEALTSGAHAQFDHIASLASAKSLSEVLALQSEFARKRFEAATSQAKEMTELARKLADESVAPLKAHVAKSLRKAV